jgi:soluble lytic murein transglycosylase-like protein
VLVAKLLAAQGYKGDELRTMLAIAMGESSLNARAHNNTGRDDSYGLFQINMKNDDPLSPNMGTKRLAQYGLTSNEDLFDAATNVRVAAEMQRNSGFSPWSVYTSGKYRTNMDQAASYASAAGVGDAVLPAKPSGGGSTIVNGGHSITIAPSITVMGGSSWQADLPLIAKEVGRLLQQEVGRLSLRSS